MNEAKNWLEDILAHPITKKDIDLASVRKLNGKLDLRVYLPNTHGFSEWEEGQKEYEKWYASGDGYKNDVNKFLAEIEYDRPIYEKFKLTGSILDVGGGVGTTREFIEDISQYVCCDPFMDVEENIPSAKVAAYKCLTNKKLNFIGATAEFLPFRDLSFDWVHMRSMLDHVQVPDLAIIEAHRVLKDQGSLLVGLYVEGGEKGGMSAKELLKHELKELLARLGFSKYKDHHTWHPSFPNLKKIIMNNGFIIDEIFWQPHWNNTVVYIRAKKA